MRDSNQEEPVECIICGESRPRSEMLRYGEVFVAPEHKDALIRRLESGDDPTEDRGFRDAPVTGEIRLVFSQAFQMIRRQIVPIAIGAGSLWLLIDLLDFSIDWYLVDHSLGTEPGKPLHPIQGQLISLLISLTLGLLAEGVFILIAHRGWEGEKTEFFTVFSEALAVWSRFFRTRLLNFLIILVGFLFLVIPGIFLAVKLYVSEIAAVVEKRRPVSAVKHSYWLTGGSAGLAMVMAILVPLIFGGIPAVILHFGWEHVPVEHWVPWALISWFFSLPAIAIPFLFYVSYRHLRGRHSDLDSRDAGAIEEIGGSSGIDTHQESPARKSVG